MQRAFSTLQRTVANCRRLVASAMHSCHMCCAASTPTLHVCVCMCTHFRSALAGVCESYGACSSERAQLLRPAARHSRTRTGRAHGSRFWTSVAENPGGCASFVAACLEMKIRTEFAGELLNLPQIWSNLPNIANLYKFCPEGGHIYTCRRHTMRVMFKLSFGAEKSARKRVKATGGVGMASGGGL